jgi:hypothetical protein
MGCYGAFTKETAKLLGDKGRAARKKGVSSHREAQEYRKRLMKAAWWVVMHKENARGPSQLHRILQAVCVDDPKGFVRNILLPSLPPPPREQPMPVEKEVDREKELIGDSLEALDRWWRETNQGKEDKGGEVAQ